MMNALSSSGWGKETFVLNFTFVEISCRAKESGNCTFLIAPSYKIQEYIKSEESVKTYEAYDLPFY
jgi:hypothetical protein